MMGVVDSELAQQVEAFAMYPRDLGLICGTRNLCVLLSLFFFLFCQLVTAGVIWEERTSAEKLCPSDWPVGSSVGLID